MFHPEIESLINDRKHIQDEFLKDSETFQMIKNFYEGIILRKVKYEAKDYKEVKDKFHSDLITYCWNFKFHPTDEIKEKLKELGVTENVLNIFVSIDLIKKEIEKINNSKYYSIELDLSFQAIDDYLNALILYYYYEDKGMMYENNNQNLTKVGYEFEMVNRKFKSSKVSNGENPKKKDLFFEKFSKLNELSGDETFNQKMSKVFKNKPHKVYLKVLVENLLIEKSTERTLDYRNKGVVVWDLIHLISYPKLTPYLKYTDIDPDADEVLIYPKVSVYAKRMIENYIN